MKDDTSPQIDDIRRQQEQNMPEMAQSLVTLMTMMKDANQYLSAISEVKEIEVHPPS